jgi:hypothetical protein
VKLTMRSQFRDLITDSNITGLNNFGVNSTEPKLLARRRIYESQCRGAKALTKFGTAVVRLFGDFEDAFANGQSLTRVKVFATEIQINKEIISGQLPALFFAGEQMNHPGVRDTDLNVRVRTSIREFQPASTCPGVAFCSSLRTETTLRQTESLFRTGTNDDCFEQAVVLWRIPDILHPVENLCVCEVGSMQHYCTFANR